MGIVAEGVVGALDATTLQSITDGFATLTATVSQVIPLAVAAAVSIIALTGGVNYALKKVRGVIHQAA